MPDELPIAPEEGAGDGALPKLDSVIEENNRLKEEIAQKDTHLKQKTEQFHNLRNQKFRTFSDMTTEEKEMYTPEQLEVFERQDVLSQQLKETQEDQRKQLTDYQSDRISKLANGDPATAQKLKDNLARLSGADAAKSTFDIDQNLNDAWSLLGNASPNPLVHSAPTGNGTPPNSNPTDDRKDFSESKDGQELSTAMGLPVAPKS